MTKNLKQRVLEAINKSGNSASHSSLNSAGGSTFYDIQETLTSDCFQLCKIVRHGFPYKPTAIAYDPMQRLVAIGNMTGSIRLLGQPGVDVHVTHDIETPVTQLLFLINEGGLISVCADNSVNMWNLRQNKPGILHTLKFNREQITFCHLPYQSKWLYIGTDRGNVHLCCIETFVLSGYIINWNKAIELSQKSHPGHIVGISENPCDENRLLIAFETGLLVLWDLKSKMVEYRYYGDSGVQSVTWHHEGKQFMCCHGNGSLSLWNYRNVKPQQVQFPHSKSSESSKFDNYWPINQVKWSSCRASDPFVIFTGGLHKDEENVRPSVTIMRGKSMTVLEMDYNIVDFIVISKTPWRCDFQDPVALAVLLDKELVVVDLVFPGYPSIEFPHPIDIHDSPVTCLQYLLDSNSDLTPGLYQVAASKPRRLSSKSKNEWPMDGGEYSIDSCTGSPEILVTGHADGTVRFWDASAVSLRELFKLRTYKYFKREKRQENATPENDAVENDNFAISQIKLYPESRCLLVSNVSGAVMFCELNRNEVTKELASIDLQPLSFEVLNLDDSPVTELPHHSTVNDLKPLLKQGSESLFIQNTTAEHKILSKSYSDDVRSNPRLTQRQISHCPPPLLKLRSGSVKQSAGFQAELICQLTGIENDVPITEICYSTVYSVFAVGTLNGLYVIDAVQKKIILAVASSELVSDRKGKPRSPNRIKPPTSLGDIVQMCAANDSVSIKSPSIEMQDGAAQSGSRTPYRESTSSVGSTASGPPPRPKKPPTRSGNKKSSFSFDKSLDSQTSVATDDSSFSRTSSVSEFERSDPKDTVTSLVFADTFARKDDNTISTSLWVGTAAGIVYSVEINLPEHREDVQAAAFPTGTHIQMKGSIVNTAFLNSLGQLTTNVPRRSPDVTKHKLQTQMSSNVDKHFVIISSEKQIKVCALPSQSAMHVYNLPAEAGYVLRTEISVVQGTTCLLSHTSLGHISILSLPSLSVLLDVDYLPPNNIRIAQTLCFTPDAQAVFMPTPSEVQRMTCSIEMYESIQETIGHLFIPCEAPERPNPGFFKSLFGGGVSELDREELFGEASSGKASRGVAKHIPGSGSMSLEGLRGQAQHGLTQMEKLRLAALERGEKLGEIEKKTQRMQESAQKFSENAHSLMMKYKNKKWYQF